VEGRKLEQYSAFSSYQQTFICLNRLLCTAASTILFSLPWQYKFGERSILNSVIISRNMKNMNEFECLVMTNGNNYFSRFTKNLQTSANWRVSPPPPSL